jgi:hypothetical protein
MAKNHTEKIIYSLAGVIIFTITPLIASATNFSYSLTNDGNKTIVAGATTTGLITLLAPSHIGTHYDIYTKVTDPFGTTVHFTGPNYYISGSGTSTIRSSTYWVQAGSSSLFALMPYVSKSPSRGPIIDDAYRFLTTNTLGQYFATTTVELTSYASTTLGVYTITSTSSLPQIATCKDLINYENKGKLIYPADVLACYAEPPIVASVTYSRSRSGGQLYTSSNSPAATSTGDVRKFFGDYVCGKNNYASTTGIGLSAGYVCKWSYTATPSVFTVTVVAATSTVSYDPVIGLASATSTCNGTSTPVTLNWTAPSNTNYIGFFVYRSDKGTTTPIATISFTNGTIAKTYQDSTATTTGNYTYYVSAAYVNAESTKASTTIAVSACTTSQYSCSGVVPSGFTQCTNATNQLTQNLEWSQTYSQSSCSSAPKCSYYPTGVTYACTSLPTIPVNQSLHACRIDSNTDLTVDTAWSQVGSAASCSLTTKCQYYITELSTSTLAANLSLKIAEKSDAFNFCSTDGCKLANIARGKTFALQWINENDTDTDYTCMGSVTTSSGASAASYFPDWSNRSIDTIPSLSPAVLSDIQVGNNTPLGYYVFTISCTAKKAGLGVVPPTSATLHVFQSKTTEQ